MKLKMRHEMRRSQEEIEASFNPINLDYIFEEDDPLSSWIEERENPLLDGVQNSEWLPRMDSEDENMEANDDDAGSNQNSGDLSPPSSGNNGDNIEVEESDDEEEDQRQNDSCQELPYNRRDKSLMIDMTTSRADNSSGNTTRGGSHSKRGRHRQNVALEDSSSASIAQSFGGLSVDESSQRNYGNYVPSSQNSYGFCPQSSESSHGNHPQSYQHPCFQAYGQHTIHQAPPMNYQDFYYQQQGGGFFDYVFGQGGAQDDSQSESGGYDLPRHSTMW